MTEDGNRTSEIKAAIADRLLKIANDVENHRTACLVPDLNNIVQFLLELESLSQSEMNSRVCFDVIDLICRAVLLVSETDTDNVQRKQPPVEYHSKRGRPSFKIPKEALSYYIDNEFTINEIADLLSVSRSTTINRMNEYELSIRQTYTQINDEELDHIVSRKVEEFPDSGFKSVLGHLKADGVRVQERRMLESMRRVDPFGVMVRKMFMKNYRVKRKTYSVRAPNSLWHVDSNHKLIRWRFVIHGGIDGFSRLPTYLLIAPDNTAATALTAFRLGVNEYGLPERVRSDKGKENIRIAEFMLQHRGLHKNSHITGRSVHNQRIERFWREVWHGCTGAYHQLFCEMEQTGVLDVDNELDIYALHAIYLNRIQNSLYKFIKAVARRPLRTEGNRTPLQLWIMGQTYDQRDELLQEDAVMYGVDFDGPVDMNLEEDIVVPPISSVPDYVIDTIDQIRNTGEHDVFDTGCYLRTKAYLSYL